MRGVEYDPRTLEVIPIELRDSSELAVGPAPSALLFENRELVGQKR